MMKSLLIAGAVTAAASANDIDLFATSSWDDSSYLMQQAGYWNPAIEGWVGGPVYVGVNRRLDWRFPSVMAGSVNLYGGSERHGRRLGLLRWLFCSQGLGW